MLVLIGTGIFETARPGHYPAATTRSQCGTPLVDADAGTAQLFINWEANQDLRVVSGWLVTRSAILDKHPRSALSPNPALDFVY
jgi:hypothetical protein